ncbi:MAG: dephospho-CoA kinase [Peptococcaceae bacterium]|jgi:dephospho-CoA kinase|nr:dephospho-CoA kinase [Peptococcaceae bacterium]
MRLIGLAGGIASGKTMVTDYLVSLGAPVVDADVISRSITAPGSPVLKEIATAFGDEYLDGEGNLLRKKLGELIFNDRESRLRLNQITHPHISRIIRDEINQHRDEGAPIVIYSAPLLLEGGSGSMTDEVWLVALEPREQIRRLMGRDGITEEEAKARLGSQSSLEEKMSLADKVIDNSGTPEETREQVMALWEDAMRMADAEKFP